MSKVRASAETYRRGGRDDAVGVRTADECRLMGQVTRSAWCTQAFGAALFLVCCLILGSRLAAGPADLASYDALIKPEQRRHWAFQPVRRPGIPPVKDREWLRNPIDAFVLAKLEARGWKPSPPVERRQFLRRLYADVLGLPPTPAAQDAYLDKGLNIVLTDAYAPVDNLMAVTFRNR